MSISGTSRKSVNLTVPLPGLVHAALGENAGVDRAGAAGGGDVAGMVDGSGRLARVAGVGRVPERGLAVGVGAWPGAPGTDRGRRGEQLADPVGATSPAVAPGNRDGGAKDRNRGRPRQLAIRAATGRGDGSGWPVALWSEAHDASGGCPLKRRRMRTALPSPADRGEFRFAAANELGAVWRWVDEDMGRVREHQGSSSDVDDVDPVLTLHRASGRGLLGRKARRR